MTEITPADLRQVLAWLDRETLAEFKRNQPELWAKSQSDMAPLAEGDDETG
jgi:hypothetical protein